MKSQYPLYEGDGIIHAPAESSAAAFEGEAGSLSNIAGSSPCSGSDASLFEIEKAAREHRSRTLAALISRFLDWIEAGIQRAKYRDLEAYLAKSADLADLEPRMRRIEGERRNMLPVG